MTTPDQWSRGDEGNPVKLKVRNESDFIALCARRYQMAELENNTNPRDWLALAAEFEAVGAAANAAWARARARQCKGK